MRRPSPLALAFCALLLLCPGTLGAAEPAATVALSDFAVNSADPANAFLGKGFAEIVAFELKKSPAVKLVDRDKRNALLEEMEFSMSGAADQGQQAEMGKLLSVKYMVFGSITDMGGQLLVSLSMVEVETGEVVWNDQLMESKGKYGYIGAYFGKSLLKHFKAATPKSMEMALEKPVEKDAASVVAMSAGIDALDKGDKAEAKKQLDRAKKIDPGNAVAAAYLGKLASASAKFKVVPERYVSYYNPAYLGGMEKDRLFYDYSYANLVSGDVNPTREDDKVYWLVLNADESYGTYDQQSCDVMGYQLPLSPRLGLGFEFAAPRLDNDIQRPITATSWMESGHDYYGYMEWILSCGYQVSPALSLGFGAILQSRSRSYYSEYIGSPPPDQADENDYWLEESWTYGGIVAAALKSPGGALAWDIVASWTNDRLYYFDIDPAVLAFVDYGAPLYVEQTLSWSPNGQKTFLALKQANDIYLDRDLYYGRIMPCVEQWFWNLFSLRLGAEGSVVYRDGQAELGWGATAGATLRVWKFELDANYTLRQRPSRCLSGVTLPEYVFFVTGSVNDLVTPLMRKAGEKK